VRLRTPRQRATKKRATKKKATKKRATKKRASTRWAPLVEFESMVVNLRAETTDRYLKLTFQLELRGEDQLEHVETHMPAFRDAVLMHLTSLTIENVQGAENALHLREQLLAMARQVFGRRSVSHVYFTEYLVQ
jgi:flagellar FliL protein